MESPVVPFGDHPWSVTVLAASACALGASSGTTEGAQCPSPCSEAMIRSHRITHRRLFPLIAVLALLLSVLALSLRPAVPVSSSASAPLFQTLGFAGEALSASRSVRVKVNGTPVRLAYRLSRSQQPTLLIEPQRIMPEAQVQVLWTPGQVSEAPRVSGPRDASRRRDPKWRRHGSRNGPKSGPKPTILASESGSEGPWGPPGGL